MNDKLTIKQEAFAQEVFKSGKPEKALVVAYPTCAKWKPESIRVKASRMMAKANITLRIEHLQAEAATWLEMNGGGIYRNVLHNLEFHVLPIKRRSTESEQEIFGYTEKQICEKQGSTGNLK